MGWGWGIALLQLWSPAARALHCHVLMPCPGSVCVQAASAATVAAGTAAKEAQQSQRAQVPAEVGGCGGFGKGNFR